MKLTDEGLIRKPKLITFLIVGAFAIFFAYLAQLFFNSLSGADPNAKWSAVGGYFQGVVGSAISIGTMVSSVSLAFLALQIVLQQERREISNSTQSFLTDGIRPLFGIARELNAVLYSAERLLHPSEHLGAISSKSSEFVHFLRCLQNLCKAMEEVGSHPYSNSVLREAGRSKIRLLHKLGIEEPGEQINKLSFWTSALRYRILELENASESHIARALKDFSQLSNDALVLRTNKHSELTQTILFAGHLIWSFPLEGQDRLVNAGAALLLEIADALPKGKEIEAMLKSNFFSNQAWYLDREVPLQIKNLIEHNALDKILISDLLSDLEWFGKDSNWQLLEYRRSGK